MSLHNAFVNELSSRLGTYTESVTSILASHYGFSKEEAINIINKNFDGTLCSTQSIHNNRKSSCLVNDDSFNILRTDTIENETQNDKQLRPADQEKPKKKRGRPKKIVDESAETTEDKPKKRRGRPKKNNSITIVQDTDDENNSLSSSTDNQENNKEEDSKSIANLISTSNINIELQEETYSENEDIPEIEVEKWTFEGKEYLKDERNHVYDAKTHESFGFFSVEENKIIIMN